MVQGRKPEAVDKIQRPVSMAEEEAIRFNGPDRAALPMPFRKNPISDFDLDFFHSAPGSVA